QATRPQLELDVETGYAYVIYRNSTDGHTYLSSTSMSSPGFGLRCIFLDHGTNVTSTKQNVNSSTGLVAADSDTGQIFPAQIGLPSAPASVTFGPGPNQSSTDARTPASTGPTVDLRRSRADAATTTTAGVSLPGTTPVPEYKTIWAGRLSTSDAPASDSEWWWLRSQGVNTIVNLEPVMFDFVQYGFESF